MDQQKISCVAWKLFFILSDTIFGIFPPGNTLVIDYYFKQMSKNHACTQSFWFYCTHM